MPSGAGAEITALAESLQCYAAAARQHKGKALEKIDEVTTRTTSNAKADRTLQRCKDGLDESWYYSVIATANQMFQSLPKKRGATYEFHRGSPLVNKIYKHFNDLKQNSGITGNDKWNPADIWVVNQRFVFDPNIDTLKNYNEYLYEQYHAGQLMGVSLKKVPPGSSVTSKVYNDGRPTTAKFQSFSVGTNPTDSKDAYINFVSGGIEGRIQLRTFSDRPTPSAWQGEIKGKTAAGGKIGGGIVMRSATSSGVSSNLLTSPQEFTSQIYKPRNNTFDKFAKMFKELSGTKTSVKILSEEAEEAQKKDPSWWLSKYISVNYCYGLKKSGLENKVVNTMFQYASSQSKNSSIFMKYYVK